ncbi:hypothetical protein AOQ84DRAFT_402088, partial [Glonium stellatum]
PQASNQPKSSPSYSKFPDEKPHIEEQCSDVIDAWCKTEASKNSSFDPAKEAFEEAVKHFSSYYTKDDRKIEIARNATGLEDIRDIVIKATVNFEDCQNKKKMRKWLGKLATRL